MSKAETDATELLQASEAEKPPANKAGKQTANKAEKSTAKEGAKTPVSATDAPSAKEGRAPPTNDVETPPANDAEPTPADANERPAGLRQICIDTETTGLRADKKDRVIEVGAVEIIDRKITNRTFHQYIDPQVSVIDPKAVAVHGLTAERLQGEPTFRDCYQDLIDFIKGAELIIHNAPFDVGFLNAEFKKIKELKGKTVSSYCPKVIDTLTMAQSMRPGQGNSLDDLRDFYKITDKREKHGALIDAQILAKVFLRLTGVQDKLELGGTVSEHPGGKADLKQHKVMLRVAKPDEVKAHDYLMKKIRSGKQITDQDFQLAMDRRT